MTFLKRLWQWFSRRQDSEPETSEGIPYNYNSVLDIWHSKTEWKGVYSSGFKRVGGPPQEVLKKVMKEKYK